MFAFHTGDSPVKLLDYPYHIYDRMAAFTIRDGRKV
jgi:hypothetical protein